MKQLIIFLIISLTVFLNPLFSQEIKDKTKYYVSDIENFNNYSSNGWSLLDNNQLKTIAKALNIKSDEAQKIITSTSYYNHPKNKKNTDVAYIMYKVCELNGYKNGGFKYDNILCLMYVPNELNTHLPSDKLADNGKGFFQVTNKESISTTPLSAEYYKPSISLKNENYSFGFKFEANGIDSLIVLKVIKTSPAEKAGFKADDIIIEFNNQQIRYKSKAEILKIFKESNFTNNTFKVLRNNTTQTLTVDKVNVKTLEFICVSANCENGDCVIENINGYSIKGKCKDGNLISNAIFTADDGFVFYEGAVKKTNSDFNKYNYVRHGFGKEHYKNGNTFEGNFINGKKEGNGVLTFADGTQQKGIWKENKYYDDISIGFANERFRVYNNRIYLHHLNTDFKTKMVAVSDEEKKKAMSKYNLSEDDITKLFALCDMKYKPTYLNTPEKIKTVIEKNQKEKPYEAYYIVQIYGTDKEAYYIIYLPTAYNRWQPEGVKFDTQDGLYFCVPSTAVQFTDYYNFESMLAVQKGAEQQKKREQEQLDLSAKHYDWAAKNKFKGVIIAQYENVFAETDNRYKYNVISIFGPSNQYYSEENRQTLFDTYKDYYKNKGYTLQIFKFMEGMDEVQATEKANDLTQTHRFNVNTNFNYTLPQWQTQTNSSTVKKELQDKVDEAIKERDKIWKEINSDRLIQKTTPKNEEDEDFDALEKTAVDINKNTKLMSEIKFAKGTQVKLINVFEKNSNYNEAKKYFGKTCTTLTEMKFSGENYTYGKVKFSDGIEMYFDNAILEIVK